MKGQRPRPGRALLLGLAAQLFWLLCCFWSYTVVAQFFGYEGYVVVSQPDASRLPFVVLALVGLSLLLPRRLASPSDYVVVALFDISFVPFCAHWVLSSQPWWHGLLLTVYWGLVLLVSRFPVRLPVYHVKGTQNTAFFVARGLLVLGGILIVSGGHLTLTLPFSEVYSVREVWASEGSRVSGYLFPWLANAVLPFLLAHAWKNRRLDELLVIGFAAYMLFTSTGMKTYLFIPALVAAVLLVAQWRPSSSIIPIGLGIFSITVVLLGNITGEIMWTSLGLRRALFVPARLTSTYLEFFATNPVVRLSGSVLRGWFRNPYPVSVPYVIGAVLGQPTLAANNGLVADGFANFGIVGSLVWAVLLGILIRLLRVATERRENRPEAWAVATMWPVILVSSSLTTSLLTHGLAVGLLMAWSLRPERPAIEGGVRAKSGLRLAPHKP